MDISEQIIQSPLFQKTKSLIEKNPWHDNESVYDHLIKTHRIATEKIAGEFITNPKAKAMFLDYVNEDLDGVKRKDILLITALVHDIGKILYYNESGDEKPIRHENPNGTTRLPGHEYWGSTIIPQLLENTKLNKKILKEFQKL